MTFFTETGIESDERVTEQETRVAFEKARNRKLLRRFDKHLLDRSERDSLRPVNRHSRIKWGKLICEEVSQHLCDEGGLLQTKPVYFVTLVDITCATDTLDAGVDIEKIKKRLCTGLRGISHLGIIEPAFYTNLQVGVRFQGKRCLFWHLHALAWGISRNKMKMLVTKLESSGQYLAIAEKLRGAHAKKIKQGDLPKVTGYMLKSPGCAYRVSRMDMLTPDGGPLINEDGEVQARFFQKKSRLRKGERITLFIAMKNLRLDRMAVAGVEGSALLARAKRIALST